MRSFPVLSAMKGDSGFTCVNHMFVCKTFPSEAGEEYKFSRHASKDTVEIYCVCPVPYVRMAAFIFSLLLVVS